MSARTVGHHKTSPLKNITQFSGYRFGYTSYVKGWLTRLSVRDAVHNEDLLHERHERFRRVLQAGLVAIVPLGGANALQQSSAH